MSELSVREFLIKHGACRDGREWALAECETMREVWDTARPDWMVWVAIQPGVLTDRELRLFSCWRVRQSWDQLTDVRSRQAVEVAERYANGQSTDYELAAARSAAWAAAEDAARDAWSASWSASWAAALASARDAWDTAWAAAWDAARDALDTAWDAQAAYLRENCTPSFEADK